MSRASSGSGRSLTKILVASSLGTLFEWYDFYLYGTLAVFFGELFFPPGNERASLLASLATFGAGFGVRPLGALVFGWVGDRVGRKYTFLVTLLTMGLATAFIGFLPTYATLGIAAPILLVTLRLVQGLFGSGAIYTGLAYPIGVCVMTVVVGGLLIRETKDHRIDTPIGH